MKKRVCFLVFLLICVFWTCIANAELNELKSKVLKLPDCAPGQTVRVPIHDAEYIELFDGRVVEISELRKFKSQTDADKYINELREALSNPIQENPVLYIGTRATHGNARVASITFNGINTVGLYVDYTTSGDSNTGIVTYHNAYTTFSGFTLGISWHEITCHSEVTPSGKDIYASAAGSIVYYLLIEDFIELGRENVNLSGYCMAIH